MPVSRLRILVTGGAGFIGSHVVDGYLADGHEVLVLDDLSTGREENLDPGARLEICDIRDISQVRDILKAFHPDIINHHAAQIDVRRSVEEPILDLDVNVRGTIALISEATRLGVRGFVFASSGGAIAGECDAPASEATEKRPLSPYGAAKAAVEQYLFAYHRSFGLPYVALRYGNVYGPRQSPDGEAGVVSIFARTLLEGRRVTIFGTGGQTRDLIYVRMWSAQTKRRCRHCSMEWRRRRG